MCKRKKVEGNNSGLHSNNKSLIFHKLTPVRDAIIDTYSEAIDYAFHEDDVRNIAITGIYGSGKSSIVETYEEKHKELRFVHLTLAHFIENDDSNTIKKETKASEKDAEKNHGEEEDGKKNEENDDIKTIEGKLINQLIHQIDTTSIPETNFSIKKNVDKSKYKTRAALLCIAILFIVYNLHYSGWRNHVLHIKDEWLSTALLPTLSSDFRVVAFLFFVFIIGFIIFSALYYLAGKKHLRKISIKGNEIEIFSESKDSYFDRYLNEVLYLFEHADADAFVFEDIDRFDNPLVFERLREINTLLYARQKKGIGDNERAIRFFYLLRDDLFHNNNNKDRTKFFDFVIPIVPAVDSSNSYDKLHQYLKETDLIDTVNNKFLRRLSVYIDDLRMLKNIYNEFVIYRNKLNSNSLDNNKLLAIISYKNLFPRDFAELQQNKGFLYTLFIKKKDLITKHSAKLHEEYNAVCEKIELCEKEPARSTVELDVLDNYYKRNGFNSSKQQQEWKTEYEKRGQILNPSLEQNLIDLNKRKIEIEKQLAEIEHQKIAELLTADYIDDTFSKLYAKNEIGETEEFSYLKASPYFPLLKYLVSNGYIDESYSFYMSYFYEGALTINDKVYVSNVYERKTQGYSYSLNSPDLIMELSYLDDYDFKYEETLNYDMFEYILRMNRQEAIKNSIDVIKEKEKYDFIEGFIYSQRPIDNMVVAINHGWPSMFRSAVDGEKLSSIAIVIYNYKTVETYNDKTFESAIEQQYLKDIISNDPSYLGIYPRWDLVDHQKLASGEVIEVPIKTTKAVTFIGNNHSFDNIMNGLLLLGISFKSINYEMSNKELFDFVYNNNLYEINAENIRLMLEKECGKTYDENYMSTFMTFVMTCIDLYPLCKYLRNHLLITMSVYMDMYKGLIHDKSEIIVKILNQDSIDEIKETYIGRLATSVKKLKEIDNPEIQALLLKHNTVDYTIENVEYYFVEKGLDENLVAFINSGDGTLDMSGARGKLDKFVETCIRCDDLSDEKYQEIVQERKNSYDVFDIPNISESHMKILIKSKIVPMNLANLTFMRSDYPESLLGFILENKKEYMELVKSGEYNAQETKMLLVQKRLSYQYKIELVKQSKTFVSISGLIIQDTVKKYILTHKLEMSDLPWLMRSFPFESPEIKDIIYDLVVSHKVISIQHAGNMGKELRTKIFDDTSLEKSDKISILDLTATKMNKEELLAALRSVGAYKIADDIESSTYKPVNVNGENEKILTILANKQVIQAPEIAKDKRHYKKIRLAERKHVTVFG